MAKRDSLTGAMVGFGLLAGLYFFLTRKASATTVTSPGGVTTTTYPAGGGTVVVSAPQPVPGSIAPVGSQISAAAAIWQNLTPMTGPQQGYVNFPSGTQAAAALLPFAVDELGNAYTKWAGQLYIVTLTPDAQGNFSAKLLGS